MPTIIVTKPFGLRLASHAERRSFGPGSHEVSEAELAHWFMQSCLADGRAVLVAAEEDDPDAVTEPAPEPAPAVVKAPKKASKKAGA